MTGYGFFGQFQKIEQQIYLPKNLDNRVASERMLAGGRKMLVGGRKYDGKLVGGNMIGKFLGGKCWWQIGGREMSSN